MNAVPAGNDAPDGLPGFRIHANRILFHTLLKFETPDWFRRISRFVNVNWHFALLGRARLLFRLGWFLGWFRFHPLGVKHTRFVDAFVGMRAKEVALSLE